MKKLFLLLAAASFANLVSAQYKVGDVYEKDGVKAVIFYVDNAGEQGLAITVDESQEPDMLYKMHEDLKKMSKSEKKEFKANHKETENSVKAHYDKLVYKTSSRGAENMKVIKEYCTKNDIDMNKYFPALVWAESLGEGWFVPGSYEAELYAKYIAFGVGKSSYKGTNMKDIKNRYQELNTQLKSNAGFENLNLPKSIKTSSIGHNSISTIGSSWCIYKSLELREEQSDIAGFSFRSDCYYDIEAYRPMMGMGTWVSYGKIAVRVVDCSKPKGN
ncbi:MAG: hypothetical protein E7137_01140 [Rikenellaceae bacterium]|nr:hypothetical protein [Rikenellaceae bacterium]